MDLPIIFCIDDDTQVLSTILRDLKSRYRENYKILGTNLLMEGLDSLLELKNQGNTVAMLISDQQMPEMNGVDFLQRAIRFYPQAKRILLTAYSDKDAAINAINIVQLDYYFIKPWDPPEEKLFPVIDGLLESWLYNYHPDFKGIKVIGYQYSQMSYEIKDFLAGNLVPYQWLDIQVDNEGEELLRLNNLDNKQLPIVFQGDGSYLIKPSIKQIAEKIGLNSELKHQDVYDVVIIGAGPAGLAAAVYGASEGLKTLLIERRAPGGQAGTSSRIENYLGFPAGLSGEELTRRAITQAARLGTEFLSLTTVGAILSQDGYKKIMLEDAGEINARSVVITTGVDYRKLETKGVSKFNGAGIYYGAAMTEATASTGKDVYVVGGGNSAGQAAMYLSKFAKNVFIIIRKDNLSSTMSAYLIDQIEATDNIQIIPGTVVTVARGTDKLEQIEIFNEGTKKSETKMAGAMYIFIGAKPFTDWLDKTIIKDEKGFIVTGRDLKTHVGFEKIWKQKRDPYLLETSWPGVFAAGDVRSGAMNRVASAVGEGSMAISFVNKYLAEVK